MQESFDAPLDEGEDIELTCYEHLESEGWADSCCPSCLEKEL